MSRLALLPQEHPYKAFITCPEGYENSRNLNKFILATSVAHLLLMSHLLNRFSSRMIFKFKLSRAPLLNVVLSVLQVWDAAGRHSIQH